jgi:hypothetical protein
LFLQVFSSYLGIAYLILLCYKVTMTAERAPRHIPETSEEEDWREARKREALENGMGVSQVEANARLGTGETPIQTRKDILVDKLKRKRRRSAPSEAQREANELRYPRHIRAQPLPFVQVVPVEEKPEHLVQGELDIDWE